LLSTVNTDTMTDSPITALSPRITHSLRLLHPWKPKNPSKSGPTRDLVRRLMRGPTPPDLSVDRRSRSSKCALL
jgi:hypothetical protein